MKLIAILLNLVILLQSGVALTQWTQYSGIPLGNKSAVGAYDPTTFFATQPDSLLRSFNAGATWTSIPISDIVGNNLIGITFYDIEYVTATTIVAVGFSFLGNQEVVFRSLDGGVTWAYASIYNLGNYPRISNAVEFVSPTVGIVVGTNGRILRTTNGGANWSQINSGGFYELKDLFFATSTIGFAVGNNVILRTTNAGLNWSSTALSNTFLNAISFPSTTLGFAVGNQKKMLKTINSGLTWLPISLNIPESFDINSVHFTTINEGYIAGSNGKIYKTINGGQYWSKISLTPELNRVFFLDQNTGLLAGDNGQLLSTSNGGGAYTPISNFNLQSSTSCSDSIIPLLNSSDPSLNFQWFVNGNWISNSYNSSVTLSYSGQNDTITLVASNGVSFDTLSRIISVQPGSFVINGGIQSTTICSGQSKIMYVYNSVPGIVYSITKNGVQVGSTQNGNNGTLSFNTGTITTSSVVCVKGLRNVSGCGIFTDSWCTTLTPQNPNPSTVISVTNDSICVGTNTTFVVANSEIGVTYQLMQGAVLVGSLQTGTGGNLIFQTNNIVNTSSFFIRGTSVIGCITNYPAITITIIKPNVFWSASNFNPATNEGIDFINNSLFPQGSFLWDFGSNASISLSSLANPTNISFNQTGTQTISLTYTTYPANCIQTVTKEINVIAPFVPGNCASVNYKAVNSPSNTARMSSIHRDKDTNLYAIYQNTLNLQNRVFSSHGDSLNIGVTPVTNFNKGFTLVKHSKSGVPMWSTHLRSNHNASSVADVTSDSSGNVYVAYHHDEYLDSLRIYSADNRYITIDPPHSGSLRSVVIVKYDKNGMYLWHSTFLESYTAWRVSLKVDQNQNLFVSGEFRFAKYNPAGALGWSVTGDFADLEPDENGGVYVLNRTGLTIDHYDASGFLIESSNPIQTLYSITVIGGVHIVKDEYQNFYVSGNFRGSFVFGGDTLTDIFTGGISNEDVFLVKFSNNLTQLWAKQFKGPEGMPIQGLSVQGNTVLMSFLNNGNSMEYIHGDTTFTNLDNSYFIFKCNYAGLNDEVTLFHNYSIQIGFNVPTDNVALSNNGNHFDFAFVLAENFTASTGTSFNASPYNGYTHHAINLANVDCVFMPNPSSGLPVANFNPVINACVGEPIQVVDASTNSPISWIWNFSGANQVSYTIENPIVVYNTPGSYPVTLTVQNVIGQSSAYASSIQVDSVPTFNVSGTTDVCYNNDALISISSSSNYLWPNNSNSPNFSLTNIISDTSVLVVITNGGCSVDYIHEINLEAIPTFLYDNPIPTILCDNDEALQLPSVIPTGGVFSSNLGSISNNVFDHTGINSNTNVLISYNYLTPLAACPAIQVDTILISNSNFGATISADSISCVGASVNFLVNSASSINQWQWDFGTGNSPNNLIPSTSAIFDSAGIYEIGLIVSDGNCFDSTATQSITINPSPNVQIDPFTNDSICEGIGLINLPNASPSGGVYSDLQNAIVSNSQIDPSLMQLNQVNYIYYEVDQGNGCTGIDSLTLTIISCLSIAEDGMINAVHLTYSPVENNFLLSNLIVDSEILIYNSIGQKIKETSSKEETYEIDLSLEASGVFFINITNNQSSVNFKVFTR